MQRLPPAAKVAKWWQLAAIPRLCCPNPRKEAPQQPFGWCMRCIGWVVMVHAPAILFWLGGVVMWILHHKPLQYRRAAAII